MDKPTDLRTNYIKRCVAQAGDKISNKKGVISINGKEMNNHPAVQHNYLIHSSKEIPRNVFDDLTLRDYSSRQPIQNTNRVIDFNHFKKTTSQDALIFNPQFIQQMDAEFNSLSDLLQDSTEFHAYLYPINEAQRKSI